MKNVKNVVKSLLLGCVVAVGCLLVNVTGANAKDMNCVNTITNTNVSYENNMQDVYSVEIQSINYIDNSVVLDKDGQLYKFYTKSLNSYYLGEKVNALIDNNKVIDFFVVDNPMVGSGVIKNVSNDCLIVSVNGIDYSIENDIGANWNVGDKVNTVIQDGKLIDISPFK
jgi:hypothetical protein